MKQTARRRGLEAAASSALAIPEPLLAALPWCSIVLGLALPIAMLLKARGAPFAFPLDDAWIHLTYARDLARHGAFTYFPGDRSSAGSTAPLFTLLETLLFFVTRNEFFIALAIGLVAQLWFLITLARWASQRLGHAGWAALAVAMVALDGRFAILAASGMETSLFLVLMAAAFSAWSRGNVVRAAAMTGVAVWVRPEALILGGVFALDVLIERRARRGWVAGLAVFVALVAGYAGFNLATGHTAFPNTLAAKAAYYAGRPLTQFLFEDVAGTFAAGWLFLLPFAVFQAVRETKRMLGPRAPVPPGPDPPFDSSVMRSEIGWAIALPLAYAIVLPFSHRFNRYLLPALPGFAIAGVAGLRVAIAAATWKQRAGVWRLAATGAAVVLLGAQWSYFGSSIDEYVRASRYQLVRHVATGRWLGAHTAPNATIGAHDVGAIAYYSNRRIVDMAGLVTPEVVPHLRKPDYFAYLDSLFARDHVTHLAVLDEWQPVDNVMPLFEADPTPEVMHVFPWKPGVTHLMSLETRGDLDQAGAALAGAQFEQAKTALDRAIAADPGAASVWVMAGALAERSGRQDEAEVAYRRAVQLFPDSPVTRGGLGTVLLRLGRVEEAQAQLDAMRARNPYAPQTGLLREAIENAMRQPVP
jgi:hypothetical protein